MTGALPSDWRRVPVSPYGNYEVSIRGEIRRDGKLLRGDTDRKGYRRVLLYYAGLRRRFAVHRLVCEAFHGPCPAAMECAHLDGNPSNNAAANLAWVTRSENTKHSIAHGTYAGLGHGKEHAQAKLNERQIGLIRQRAAEGQSERKLAAEFGISPAQTHRIIKRERWPHV